MIAFLVHYDFWIDLFASIFGLMLYVGTTHTLQQRRHPAAAVSWILMFVFLPLVAIPAYVLFGQRKIKADTANLAPPWPIQSRESLDQNKRESSRGWMSAMLMSMGGSPVRDVIDAQLHWDGQQAEASLWSAIERARERVWLSTYVLGDDRIGNELINRLAARAAQGVDVRLLLDGVGCFFVRSSQLRALTEAGGHVARSFPPMRRLLQRQSNFRNHRKMVLVDSNWFWMGGRNFADEYFVGHRASPGGKPASSPAWPDLSWSAGGDIAHDAQAIFSLDWFWACGERLPEPARKPVRLGGAALSVDLTSVNLTSIDRASVNRAPAVGGEQQVQLIASGPDHAQDSLQSFIVTACFRAQQRILAVTPYLIPDPALLQALILAARRGIAVDIVLPRRSNHLLADLARNRALRELASAGVRIWLSPEMIHAKALVFDEFAITGSANLDIRSLFLNFELAVVLYDPQAAAQVAKWIEPYRQKSDPYQAKPASLARDLLEGAVLWVGFQL